MAESWVSWVILVVVVMGGFYRLIQRACDEWDSRNYDEYHFTGYEDPKWRK